MKKKIIALFMAVAFIAAITACNEKELPSNGADDTLTVTEITTNASPYDATTCASSEAKTYVEPKPVNGTYDGYGCTDLFHGDYHISNAVIIKDGKEITRDELNKGDIIAVYFNGLIMESYPAQPAGVTKIEVVTGESSEYVPEKGGGVCKLFRVTCLAYGIFAEDYEK